MSVALLEKEPVALPQGEPAWCVQVGGGENQVAGPDIREKVCGFLVDTAVAERLGCVLPPEKLEDIAKLVGELVANAERPDEDPSRSRRPTCACVWVGRGVLDVGVGDNVPEIVDDGREQTENVPELLDDLTFDRGRIDEFLDLFAEHGFGGEVMDAFADEVKYSPVGEAEAAALNLGPDTRKIMHFTYDVAA